MGGPVRGATRRAAGQAAAAFAEMMAHVPVGEAERGALWRQMTAPNRHYHDAGHLADLWRLHRAYGAEVDLARPEDTSLIACAIAYHDAVVVGGACDNERRSAEQWMADRAAMPEADRLWVAETILATADHMGSGAAICGEAGRRARARQWMLDLDLASLGLPWPQFTANTARLRQEASHLDDAQWRGALGCFFSRLGASPTIYRLPPLHDRLERQARENIERCLDKVAAG
ncbi:hypothetical protein ASG48_12215 [Aurantimonas sp. Leaf443]|nr:hypothetical protein ASG48_12215 [Aurantimonas sp. Leaf443]